MLCVAAACMRVSASVISDGTCRLCDGGAHEAPSKAFHNDACDDAHLDPGTLRHAVLISKAGKPRSCNNMERLGRNSYVWYTSQPPWFCHQV